MIKIEKELNSVQKSSKEVLNKTNSKDSKDKKKISVRLMKIVLEKTLNYYL